MTKGLSTFVAACDYLDEALIVLPAISGEIFIAPLQILLFVHL